MKRIFAWAGILIIAAIFLALIVLSFTGGPENVILALLFCVIVIPVMLYGYALILKYVRNRNKKDDQQNPYSFAIRSRRSAAASSVSFPLEKCRRI